MLHLVGSDGRASSWATCPGSTPTTASGRPPTPTATTPTSPSSAPVGSGASPATSARSRSRRPLRCRSPTPSTCSLTCGLDVVVPQMFCLPGMTTYRSLFELLDVPYLGNTAGGDGARRRQGSGQGGRGRRRACACRRASCCVAGEEPTVPLPAVVKPVDADNSLGVSSSSVVRTSGARPCGRRSSSPTRSWSRSTSSSVARCAAGSSRSTASWSACRWRSTASTRTPSPSVRYADKLRRVPARHRGRGRGRPGPGGQGRRARLDRGPRRPGHRTGLGRGPGLSLGAGLP